MTRTFDFRELTLLLASSLAVMAGATIAPALPELEQAFRHVPDVELLVKLVMTLPALFIVIGAPLMGMLLDRGRKRPLLLAALILYALAGASGFLATSSLHAILAGRALLGLAVAGVMVGCTTLASHYFAGPRLSQFMGRQAAVGSFGGVLFLVLGGLLADLGWRYPFLLYLAALLVFAPAFATLEEPARNREPASTAPLPLRRQLPLPKLGLAYALAMLEVGLLYLVPLHYPFFARSLEAVSTAQTGVAIATLLLVMAGVSMVYKRMADRFPFLVLHGVGLALLGAGYLALGAASAYLATYVGLVIAGVGLGVMRPNLMVWLMSFTPLSLRGRVVGSMATAFFLGQFASPLATTPSIDRFGLGPTFMGAGALAVALAVLFVTSALVQRTGGVKPIALDGAGHDPSR